MEWWNDGKPKGKPQSGVKLIAQKKSHRFSRCIALEYPCKPQRGEMFVEIIEPCRIWRCSAPQYSYTWWLSWFFSIFMQGFLFINPLAPIYYFGALHLWNQLDDNILSIFRCAAPINHCFRKPKGKPQRGVILIELMDRIELQGASHRNIHASHSVAKCL